MKIQLSKETIEKLKLSLNAYDVKTAILNTKKMNLKDGAIMVSSLYSLSIMVQNSEEGIFFALQLLKKKLPSVILQGIETIRRTVIQKEIKQNRDRYLLFLEGNGLKELMAKPGVQGLKCKTNHIMEMAEVLGIEAGRQSIVDEIVSVMESHGITVNKRHILLLADTMTFSGRILGNTRHGLTK